MRTFNTNAKAESRLSTSVWPHGIGPPYIAEDEARTALALTLAELRNPSNPPSVDHRTLKAFIDEEVDKIVAARRAKQASSDGAPDFVLCASHNLAPIIQEAAGLEKGFHESKAFKKEYKSWEKSVDRQ
ncbi:hypothetical protein Hypma_014935 [Hypsizygus marmoreus]|uniref:Uncharacterized protein n=1 Tax=Hypsizygus marmoreus TaxID=39966 RepID=A0A369K6C0_HYPMA|nr:hypothetical protein Hypma_014935 [Hypsizygus marmoreus]